MLKTYTFYLRRDEPGGPSAQTPHDPRADPFEPVLCESDREACARAEERLLMSPEYVAIDLCFGQDLPFHVSRESG